MYFSGWGVNRTHDIFLGATALAVAIAAGGAAGAETAKVRLAYVLSEAMLPALYAEDKGYFDAEGIDMELIAVQGGPAAVAAVAAGEADLGYAAPMPPINARIAGVPMISFLALTHEVDPDSKFTYLIASGASGITTMDGVRGKKISFNANGGGCDLAWRDHLRAAGMTIDDVQVVVLPLPQQEAAMEQGSIDAACSFDPFFSSIMQNPAVGAQTIARGMLAEQATPVIADTVFADETWLANNMALAQGFARVLVRARTELSGDRPALEAAAMAHMELSTDAAKTFKLPVVKEDISLTAEDMKRVLDAMVATGMQPGPLDPATFSVTISY